MHNSTLRLIFGATLYLVSEAVFAAAWADLGGTSDNGDYIGIAPCDEDPLGCSDPPPKEGFAVFIRKKSAKGSGKYYERQRCTFTTNKSGGRRLTCTEGDSPLAGVTYKIIPNKNPHDCSYEEKFICIKGCNKPSVPRVLTKSFLEC
jgi:hypothetical protein